MHTKPPTKKTIEEKHWESTHQKTHYTYAKPQLNM